MANEFLYLRFPLSLSRLKHGKWYHLSFFTSCNSTSSLSKSSFNYSDKKEHTVDSRYLEYSVSRTFWYLEQMTWSLGTQLHSISNYRYLEQFSDPLESSRYRE